MRNRSLSALLALPLVAATLLIALADQPPRPAAVPPAARAAAERTVLPGLQPDGSVQLPNQWRLRPAGRQVEVGDFPVQIAPHPSGQYLAVLHAGLREHEIVIVAPGNRFGPQIVSRTVIPQAFYGICFSPDGRQLYVSGGEYEEIHQFDFQRGSLTNRQSIAVAERADTFVVGGLTVSPDGRDLFACGNRADAVVRVPLDNPANRQTIALSPADMKPAAKPGDPPSPPDGREKPGRPAKADAKAEIGNPYACLVDAPNKRLFVSLWSKAAVAVVDLTTNRLRTTWPTEAHPTEMVLSPDGKTLYVACSNSTRVSVLDATSGKARQTLDCALYPGVAPAGNTPNSLCLTPDGEMLFVANADANNLAVFNVREAGEAKPLGFIPTGWYPTSVRFSPHDRKLYVAEGKGLTPKANRNGPSPNLPLAAINLTEYIGGLFRGSVSRIDLPTPDQMVRYTRQAYACSPMLKGGEPVGAAARPADNPIPAKVGDPSPIKHVIYIIKENRTYDQVFGDMEKGNGEPGLCLFGESVTPNHHKLAREFVLLDNTYVDGEVSADGHEWSMAAYATDYVEKTWPLTYRSAVFPGMGKLGYPAEGGSERQARPAGGYIWDRCAGANLSYRSYGEFVTNGKTANDPGKATVKALEGHFDPLFRSYDTDYPDQKRADRFIEELHGFEKTGDLPRFIVMRLPNDHTVGTRIGKPTPAAMVADNDLALGRVVEAVSKSKFWKETAIFVIEDDAQNGPDHVDAHRAVALVVSPYCKRGSVDSSMYSTSSMLRTMELILGLKPMSQYDAAARPMYASFQGKLDPKPYEHVTPDRKTLDAKNLIGAYGAAWSEKADLARKEDEADDLEFNEVIWKSVRGPDAPVPAPVRAAFVRPHPKD